MARTKQSARKSTSGATLFYSRRKNKIRKNKVITDMPRTKLAVESKAKLADRRASGSVSALLLTSRPKTRSSHSSSTLVESWHGKNQHQPPVDSLSDALSKLGSPSAGDGNKSSILSTNFFSNSTRVLGVVKDVCEAFSGVPYVKGLAGLVEQIIEVADQVQAYKDRCQALVDKVVLFSQGIFEGLLSLSGDASAGEQLQSLESDLTAFLGVLESIYATLNSLTAQRVSSRFLRYVARVEYLETLTEQNRNLATYIQYFNTRSNVAIRLGLGTGSDHNLNRASRPASATKRLIPVPPTLYGRDNEIGIVTDLLVASNQQVHLAILGPGGMGKTSLALSTLTNEKVISKFEDRFFLPCDSTPSLELFLYELASALDVGTDGASSQLLQAVTHRLRQRPCLLVFDNLETLWDPLRTRSDVESFLSQIASIPTVNLLVTLRGSQHPAGVDWTQFLPPLKPLDLQSSRALFSKISHKSDDAYAMYLIKAIDRVPLAVTLLGHLAAVHGVTTEFLWERWIEEKTMMIERGDDRLANLDTSIRLSLNSPRMNHDPNALPFLSIIALLPNGMSHDMFRTCDTHLPENINIKRAINTLRQNALIYDDADRTLRILSPIRHYRIYFVQLAMLAGERVASVYERLRHEIGNLEEALVRALESSRPIEDTAAAIFSLAEYTYVSGIGSCNPLERVVGRLEKLTHSRPKSQNSVKKNLRRFFLGRSNKERDDKVENDLVTLRADCLGCWGQLLSRQARYDQAKEKFELALELHVQQEDVAGQAADPHNLACLLALDDAVEKFTVASRLHEKIGDRAGVAYDMMGLGQVHIQRCQLPQAQDVFASALGIFGELDGEDQDPIGRVTALNNIGYTLAAWNKFIEAEGYFNQAIQANESIGDVVCKADSLCGLASTFLLRSKWKEAEERITEAMRLRKPFEDPDHCHVLGRIQCAQWKLSEALETFQYTRTLPRDPKDDSGRGDDLKYLAYTFALLGRVDESLVTLEQVEAMYESAESVIGLAEVNIARAEIWTVQGKLEQAQVVVKEAIGVMEDLDCRLGKAHALYVLGGIESAKGMYHRARECVRLALRLHKEVGSTQGQADDLARLGEILILEQEDGNAMMMEVGTLDGAMENINQAMALHEGIGDTAGTGDDWYSRALLGMKRTDLVGAEEAVKKALELHRAAKVFFKQGRDYSLLGRILEAQGKKDEAVQVFDLAISILGKIGATREMAICQAFKMDAAQ